MIVAVFFVFGIYGAYLYDPIIYAHLVAEDNWGEYLTAFNYLVAFILFAMASWSSKKLSAPIYLLLCALLVLAGMEELSWGQRMVGIDTPDYLKAYNHKGEINLHNMIATTRLLSSVGWTLFIWYAVIPLACAFSSGLKNFFSTRLKAPMPPLYLFPVFFIGTFFFTIQPLIKWDEIGELMVSVGFQFFAADALLQSPFGKRPAQKLAIVSIAIVLPLLLSGMSIRNHFDGELFLYRSNLLVEGYSHKGLCVQAETLHAALDKLSLSERGHEQYPQLRPKTMFIKRAAILDRLGDRERADSLIQQKIDGLRGLLKTDGDNPILWQDLGNAYRYLGDKKTARRHYEQAIDVIKKSKQAGIARLELDLANLKLMELYRATKNWKKAERVKAQIMKDSPGAMIKKHVYMIESGNARVKSRKEVMSTQKDNTTASARRSIYKIKPKGNCRKDDTVSLVKLI